MSLDVVTNLLPHPLVGAVLAAAGAAAGVPLARFAARRTVAQPLSLALEQESRLLAALMADVTRYPLIAALTPADFAVGAHGRIYAALAAAAGPDAVPPPDADEATCRAIAATLADRAGQIRAAVTATLAADTAHAATDFALVAQLTTAGEDLTDEDLIAAGTQVYEVGNDRTSLAGAGLVLPSDTPDSADPAHPPLRRVQLAPSRLRRITTSAGLAVSALLVPAFVAHTGLTGFAGLLGGLALLVLLTLSAVIALVDLDTFYIDMPAFAVGAPAAWVTAAVALAVGGQLPHAVAGLIIVAGTALVFEGGNRVYRMIRKMDGQGFGDTIIIVATAGVPAALTGSYLVGYYGVMAGMLAGIAGWVAGAARGRLTRTSPYAFGPYLAIGWVLGWVALLLTQ